jgi:hypothetical protein
MKSLLLAASLLLMASPASVQNKPRDLNLPVLHKIQKTTLSPSYDCRTPEETAKGYANTALFLSDYSRQMNSPELLFHSICQSTNYFLGKTAGDQLDVIADFGEVPLNDLAPSDVWGLRPTWDSSANFRDMVKIHSGHTYAVLINKGDIRGFFFVQVMEHIPNQKLDLEYVVMDYAILREEQRSPGFDWSTKGHN